MKYSMVFMIQMLAALYMCSCQRQDIIRNDFDPPSPQDGAYKWAIQTDGGIFHEQRGSLRDDGDSVPSLVVEGQYQYTAPDGQIINVLYRADANGFHAEGAHLPTPPPVPAIQRAVNYLAQSPSTN